MYDYRIADLRGIIDVACPGGNQLARPNSYEAGLLVGAAVLDIGFAMG